MTLEEYGQFVVDIWFSKSVKDEPIAESNPDLTSLSIMMMGLAGEVGEVQEKVKKYLRDGVLVRPDLVKEMGDVLYYLVRIARYFDVSPQAVLDVNVNKLQSRMARGVMRGNGDNR